MQDGMHLPTKGVVTIGLIYLLIIVIFGWIAVRNLIVSDSLHEVSLSLVLLTSSSTALAVSSLFYIRKLYKDTFAGLSKGGKSVSMAATVIYYLTRPIFAAAISILFSILMYAAIRQFSEGHVGVNPDFIFFTAISSFVLSIATGAGISRLEELATSGHSFFRPPM